MAAALPGPVCGDDDDDDDVHSKLHFAFFACWFMLFSPNIPFHAASLHPEQLQGCGLVNPKSQVGPRDWGKGSHGPRRVCVHSQSPG